MIRILIVDDHAVVRQGLKKILSEQADMEVAGEAQSAEALLGMVGKGTWDILIMDISMPGRSGLDVLKDIRREYPNLPVLFMSMLPEEQFAVRALKAGASGYIAKETAPEELVKAVRKICAGGKYVSGAVADAWVGRMSSGNGRPPHEELSEREFQVLRKIAEGKSLTSIAEELFLSVKTVTTYRARILEKMHMTSNAELIRYAVDNRLID
jgi:DNA-binding NarL/FixJ family response regulator